MERLSNLGYAAFKKESTKGTVADTPDVFVPLYSESMTTNLNINEDNPVVGSKWVRHQVLQGLRGHTGSFLVMGEPNTAGYLFDMLMTKGSTTGSNPYTHPFTFPDSGDNNSYTLDLCLGNKHVVRFIGVEAGSITPEWDENKMQLNVTASARKSWYGRSIASVASQVITFDTDYDPSPTDGLVAGDILQIYDVSANAYINCTVDSIDSAVAITVTGTLGAAGAGDFVTLRPQTPSYSVLTPFLWARSEFRFGANAAAALTATHTPLEQGSNWNIMHEFENEEGAKRSGSYDPASLPRLQADAEFTARQFFDDPLKLQEFTDLAKNSVVIRHFSGSGHELRVTLNNIRPREGAKPPIETGSILYSEIAYAPTEDSSDGQACDVKVINGVSTI